MYSEQTSGVHSYIIIVVLKRISFLLSKILSFCLSQGGWVLKIA